MCLHEIYLGICRCILKIINAREGGVGVKWGGMQGMCQHEIYLGTCTCIKL